MDRLQQQRKWWTRASVRCTRRATQDWLDRLAPALRHRCLLGAHYRLYEYDTGAPVVAPLFAHTRQRPDALILVVRRKHAPKPRCRYQRFTHMRHSFIVCDTVAYTELHLERLFMSGPHGNAHEAQVR